MQILRLILKGILGIFKFINNYFKALVFLLILFFIFAPDGKMKEPNLARIDITGTIMDTSEILDALEKARLDSNIKGVLLYIDSPGGALSPSVELAMAVKRLKESKKCSHTLLATWQVVATTLA